MLDARPVPQVSLARTKQSKTNVFPRPGVEHDCQTVFKDTTPQLEFQQGMMNGLLSVCGTVS